MEDFYTGLKVSYANTVKQSANSEDVINFIVQKVNEESKTPFAHTVVKALSKGNPTRDEFIKRVFDFVCYKIDYVRDPTGKEVIFTNKLLLNRGKGDCKKQTLFIASILKAAGIEPTLKVVAYKNGDWEHIYVTAKGQNGNTIILDPVNDKKYNKEVNHQYYAEFNLDGTKTNRMPNELVSMGAKQGSLDKGFLKEHINEPTVRLIGYSDVNFIGKKKHKTLKQDLQDAVQTVKTDAKQVSQKLAAVVKVGEKVGFAPARAAFLGVIKLGEALQNTPLHFRLDQKLATAWAKYPSGISKIWQDFGGDPKILGQTILESVKTTIKGNAFENENKRFISHPFMQFHSIEEGLRIPPHIGENIGQAAAVAAALAAAMPILLAIKKFLITSKILTPNEANSMDSVIDSGLKLHGANGIPALDAKGNPVITQGAAQEKPTAKKSKTFLCTATCEYFGIDIETDPNYQKLFKFREEFVLGNDHIWKSGFKEYLKIGKKLVDSIDADEKNQNDIYTYFQSVMAICCMLIDKKENDEAAATYSQAVKSIIAIYK